MPATSRHTRGAAPQDPTATADDPAAACHDPAGSPHNPPATARARRARALTARATLAAVVTLAAAMPAAAQTITGGAYDLERGRPLAGAALLLVDSAGTVVDSTRAGADGGYRLQALRPGTYFVHVHLDGWTGVPSDGFVVEPGRDRAFDVRVPLIGAAALRQMSSILDDGEMQRPIDELCGEPLRPWEAGVLLGVVRHRRTKQPVAGARVTAIDAAGEVIRTTISSARGSFILCNLPAGAAGDGVRVSAETADGATGTARPEIRAGMAAWHDIMVTWSPPR